MFSSFYALRLHWHGHCPPLAYALAMGFSFTVMYLSGYCLVMVWLFLPSMQKELPLATGTIEAPRRNRRDTLLLFVICTLMWGSNSLYIINMPLFIINELHLPEKLAGVMMGTAAGLEIPTMLIAGYFAKRLGKRFLMRVAAVGGVCFYAGMLMAHSPVISVGLAAAKCYFIGILGGIGMLYFQDLMPGHGLATTLYTNTSRVGWIIAGGIVARSGIITLCSGFAMVMGRQSIGFGLLRIKDV